MKLKSDICRKAAVCAFAAFAVIAVKAELSVGYARIDITPPLGTNLAGYGTIRPAEGIRDPLEAVAVAFSDGTNRAIVIVADILALWGYADLYRMEIANAAGTDFKAVFFACTHTHTGPSIGWCRYGKQFDNFDNAKDHERTMKGAFATVAKLAVNDLAPAKLSIAQGEAKGISFIRRFRMKDGTCALNPGVGKPDVVAPIGEPDEQVQLLRIDREGKDSIAIVNFQCHPDTIGGRLISGDWPSVVRRTVERALPGVKCLFVNGAQGDTNHICTDPKRADLPPRDIRTYTHMGRVVAGAAIGLWDVCKPVEGGKVGYGIETVRVKTTRGTPEDFAEAQRIIALDKAGRRDELPGPRRAKTAKVAWAKTVSYLQSGPDYYDMPLSAVTIGGSIAFAGLPGEAFTAYGVQLKKKSPFKMTIPACLTNRSFGYLPMDANLKEEGYTTEGTHFTEGLEKAIMEGHLKQLQRLAGSR